MKPETEWFTQPSEYMVVGVAKRAPTYALAASAESPLAFVAAWWPSVGFLDD